MNVLKVMYDHDARWNYEVEMEKMQNEVESLGCKVLYAVPDMKIPHIVERKKNGYCVFMVVDELPGNLENSSYDIYPFTPDVSNFYSFDYYGETVKAIEKETSFLK